MTNLILYVEDEPDDVLFLRRALHRGGMADCLRVVGDGRDAIDYLAGKRIYADRRQHPLPAVILLDLHLPVMSGFEVLEWIRLQPEFQALWIVVFWSSTRDDDKAKARELGANEYIEKPRSAEGFLEVVQRLRGSIGSI